MSLNVHTTSVTITTSISSGEETLPVGTGSFIRCSNASATILIYVTAGAIGGTTATTTSFPVSPLETVYLERNPEIDLAVAAIAASGTPGITFTITGSPE